MPEAGGRAAAPALHDETTTERTSRRRSYTWRAMSVSTELGPFQPGTGGLPPYLAGREEEQSLFRSHFEVLRRGRSAPAEILLYGPRGNGKTALLRWAKREVDADDGLDAHWLVGSDIPAPADLVARLGLGSWLRKIAPENVSFAGVGVSLRRGDDRPPLLAEALEARAKAKPLLILLDEAHTLKPEVGQWILNAAQAAGSEAPFLLVLAGTPDLRARLSEMEASFWNRAEQLPLSRLDETATAEAIRRPLAEDGIAIEEEALERIVRESHGYPFFVQLWGRAAWRRVRRSAAGAGAVTAAVVEDAAGEFEARRNRCYLDRYGELRKLRLLQPARAVAETFASRPVITDGELEAAVRGGLGEAATDDEVAAAEMEIHHLGFVWESGAMPEWEPGIPSLMDYMLRAVPAP